MIMPLLLYKANSNPINIPLGEKKISKELKLVVDKITDYSRETVLSETEPEVVAEIGVDQRHIETVQRAMAMVAQEGGTASRFSDYGIKIAAKTGTAQTDIVDASDNGAFVCFAPADNPRIAIAVYVEKGGHGATIATVAKAIMDSYFSVGEVGDVTTYENQSS